MVCQTDTNLLNESKVERVAKPNEEKYYSPKVNAESTTQRGVKTTEEMNYHVHRNPVFYASYQTR